MAGTGVNLPPLVSTGNFGIGTTSPAAQLQLSGGVSTGTAWGLNGIALRQSAATYTDTVSTGTVTNAVVNGIGTPTLVASSATTYTNSATWYISAAPTAGTNVTLTNKYSLWIAAGNVLLGESINISVGTTTGSIIAATTAQKLGFHAATPVIQRAADAQAAVAGTAATNITPYGYSQSQADAIVTLVNELRAAMVEKGLIKGSA